MPDILLYFPTYVSYYRPPTRWEGPYSDIYARLCNCKTNYYILHPYNRHCQSLRNIAFNKFINFPHYFIFSKNNQKNIIFNILSECSYYINYCDIHNLYNCDVDTMLHENLYKLNEIDNIEQIYKIMKCPKEYFCKMILSINVQKIKFQEYLKSKKGKYTYNPKLYDSKFIIKYITDSNIDIWYAVKYILAKNIDIGIEYRYYKHNEILLYNDVVHYQRPKNIKINTINYDKTKNYRKKNCVVHNMKYR